MLWSHRMEMVWVIMLLIEAGDHSAKSGQIYAHNLDVPMLHPLHFLVEMNLHLLGEVGALYSYCSLNRVICIKMTMLKLNINHTPFPIYNILAATILSLHSLFLF